MRTKRAFKNFLASILLQVATAISGLIVPKLIIEFYGSETNGLVTSINQFLSYISFFEAGLTGVIMSLLYKPIAKKDNEKISCILADGRDYFNKIAIAYVVYVGALLIFYPLRIESGFSTEYVRLLIIIMSITLLFQYLFGIVNNIYIQANQKSYITSAIQTVVVVLNAIVSVVVIYFRGSIHVLKAATVMVSVINPLGYFFYVKKFYHINTKAHGSSKNIKQRWDGLCHHVCYFIQTNVDVMILTFVDLKLVSVYSVYHMITNMIRQILSAFTQAFKSGLGDLIARGEQERLNKAFSLFEYIIYSVSAAVFACLLYMILPFIKLYTNNVNDTNYYLPVFAVVMVAAELFYTVRIPYHTLTIAAGHFKETKIAALFEAGLNIIISVVFVSRYGIVGVALGTCISCLFRTVYYIIYLHQRIVYLPYSHVIKRWAVNAIVITILLMLFRYVNIEISGYFTWFIKGIVLFGCAALVSCFFNSIFFYNDFKELSVKIRNIIYRSQTKK